MLDEIDRYRFKYQRAKVIDKTHSTGKLDARKMPLEQQIYQMEHEKY